MPKQLKDILNGVKKSTVEPGSLGKDPGVDYDPKPADERRFVAKHTTEKHADRVGNDSELESATNITPALSKPTNKRLGRANMKDAEKVYEDLNDPDVLSKMSYPAHPNGGAYHTRHRVYRHPEKGYEAYIAHTQNAGGKQHAAGFMAFAPAHVYGIDNVVNPSDPNFYTVHSSERQAHKFLTGHGYESTGYIREDIDEDKKCNCSPTGKMCPVHGMKACPVKEEHIEELDKSTLASYTQKAAGDIAQHAVTIGTKVGKIFPKNTDKEHKKISNRFLGIHRATNRLATEENIEERLTKRTPASKWIDDFIKSDNPKFEGKSAAERKKMALGAYYAKQNEEVIAEQDPGLYQIALTVTDPNSPSVGRRNQKIQKYAQVRASNELEAIAKSKQVFMHRGYKIHDANFHAKIGEEVEVIE